MLCTAVEVEEKDLENCGMRMGSRSIATCGIWNTASLVVDVWSMLMSNDIRRGTIIAEDGDTLPVGGYRIS